MGAEDLHIQGADEQVPTQFDEHEAMIRRRFSNLLPRRQRHRLEQNWLAQFTEMAATRATGKQPAQGR